MVGVSLLLMALLLPITEQQNTTGQTPCMEGWFGNSCMYKCHCQHESVCGSDGSCPSGVSCQAGFFGPGCQYVNMAFTRQRDITPWFLYDNNVATCNPDSEAVSVEFSLTDPVPFYWIRVVVKDDGSRLQFSFNINGNEDCYNERRFIISNTTVDITCQTLNLLKSFSLIGRTASAVCEVFVSGGRNVALKQATNSSSSMDSTTGSLLAVDGNVLQDDGSEMCSVTAQELYPSWQLTYLIEQTLSRVVLYFMESTQCRTKQFTLTTLNALNQTVNTYEHRGGYKSWIHHMLLSHDQPVKSVRITLTHSSSFFCRTLALCEVETYGETLCPDNTYGLWCDRKCDCNPGDECHVATGACALACNNGFYGGNCTKPCPSTCLNQTCYHRQGVCIQCKPGHKGPFCDQDCEPGHFGVDCAWKCSKKCVTLCDPASGACDCVQGFGGSRCEECASGFYGDNCSKKCSEHCSNPCDQKTGHCMCQESSFGLFCNECISGMYGDSCSIKCATNCQDKLCHRDTGECVSCLGDHIGRFCEACPYKYFGHMCRFKCSSQCLNESCEDVNGTCPECMGNYGGPQCIIAPKDRHKIYWFIVPATLPVCMLVFSAIHFIRKKHQAEYSEEEDSMSDTSSSEEDIIGSVV